MAQNSTEIRDAMNFRHPGEWFEYCQECGRCEYVGSVLVPIGECWRDNGWYCFPCEGRVWWIRDGLYDAVFLTDAPRGYGPRSIRRLVDWCLLCHETVGRIQDRGSYSHMICLECEELLRTAIVEWLPHGADMRVLEYQGWM